MSIAQIKNLQRRLENLAKEASSQLDKECGHDIWRNIGFDAFEGLTNSDKREKANYYYGQWQVIRELQEVIG